MFSDYLNKALELMKVGKPFVVAVVVNYRAPVSGKPGYRAIITEDGEIWGWIGGGCSQAIIREEALSVLQTNQPKLVRISPEPSENDEGIKERKMTCHSGGTLEIFMEPVNNTFQLSIFGSSAVAKSLCALGKAMKFKVVAVGPDSDQLETADRYFTGYDPSELAELESGYIVVATQGEADDLALEAAVSLDPEYCAFVASPAKTAAMMDALMKRGINAEALSKLKAPAGLDIKATLPEEIAISILAEIVMIRRSSQVTKRVSSETAVDPICGMSVKVTEKALHSRYRESDYYFCGDGCKMTFDAQPDRYATAE